MCKVVVSLSSLVTIAEAALRLQRFFEHAPCDDTDRCFAGRLSQAINALVDEPCHCAEVAIIEQRGRSPICPACGGRCKTVYDDDVSGDMNKQEEPKFTREKLDHCEGFEGPCDRTDAEWGHNSTMYQNPRANWSYFCTECRAASDKYWLELWGIHWASVL